MYFFRPDSNRFLVIWLFIRMIGCLLIGQKFLINYWEKENQINFYFKR